MPMAPMNLRTHFPNHVMTIRMHVSSKCIQLDAGKDPSGHWWLYSAAKLPGKGWSVILRHPIDHRCHERPLWLSAPKLAARMLDTLVKDLEKNGLKHKIGEPFS